VRAYEYAALVWMRKARHNFLEHQAQDIEEQVVNPPLVQKPLPTPAQLQRERLMKAFGSSGTSGGWGTPSADSPFGPLKPKGQAEPDRRQGYGYR
jgi:hypothetical protein